MTWYEYDVAVEYHQEQLRRAARRRLIDGLPRARQMPTSLVRLAGNALSMVGLWLVATGRRLQMEPPTVAWKDQGC